jgi:hypothetical protein
LAAASFAAIPIKKQLVSHSAAPDACDAFQLCSRLDSRGQHGALAERVFQFLGVHPAMLLREDLRQGPYFNLLRLKARLMCGDFHLYRTRGLDPLRRVMGSSAQQARAFVREVVLSLEASNYGGSVVPPGGKMRDVYTVFVRDAGWFLRIELRMEGGRPAIVVCEPQECDVVLVLHGWFAHSEGA